MVGVHCGLGENMHVTAVGSASRAHHTYRPQMEYLKEKKKLALIVALGEQFSGCCCG